MAPPRSRGATSAAPQHPPAQASLSVPEAPERLVALQREHEHLLRKIKNKKKDVDRLVEKIRELAQTAAQLQPLANEAKALDAEIHGLFRELLARKRQPRGTRRTVAEVYDMLQETGVLSPAELSELDADAGGVRGPEDDAGLPFEPEEASPLGAGGFSARPAAEGQAGQSIRDVFRNLARALHPDKVLDEAEKARRTEAMKHISRAYEEGDLARLLELERTWMRGDADLSATDEVERRCAAIERTNEALRHQLKTLAREHRLLRQSPPMQMIKAMGHTSGRRGDDGIAALMATSQEELARLRELRDFVASFRDGKITLDDFMGGPPSTRMDEDDDDLDEDEVVEAFMELLDVLAAEVSPPRKKKPRGSRKR